MAPGSPRTVPPAWLPLSFLACAALGLVGFGATLALNGSTVVHSPTDPSAVATAHLAMLAFLSTAVLGAAHQFGPVVSGQHLRSVKAGLVALVLFVPGAWLLPLAFATRRPGLLEVAGVTAFTGVCVAAWNLSGPLSARGRGTPVVGLRLAVAFLVITAGFGVTYAFDRHHGWFVLMPRRVLAHAHLGLLGWLGLAYVAVAEKLWPMFLLAHRPSVKAGQWAVRLLAAGVPVVAVGLLIPFEPVTLVGAALCVAGLGAHLVSLGTVIKHRRRRMELLHGYVLLAAAALVAGAVAALVAGIPSVSVTTRMRALQTEVLALTLWLGFAVVGHLHKIVPFIGWSAMRKAGHRTSLDGKPLMFAHLVHQPAARASFAASIAAAVLGIAGMAVGQVAMVQTAGVLLAGVGAVVGANLVSGPIRIIRADARRPADQAATPAAPPVAVTTGTASAAGAAH